MLLVEVKTNQSGSTVLLMTMMVLVTVLALALSLSAVVGNGLKMSRTQTDSTKAYFAAEAGAERILWELRKPALPLDCASSPSVFCFNGTTVTCETACTSPASATTTLSNASQFFIDYHYAAPTTTITSLGIYGDNRRKIELQY